MIFMLYHFYRRHAGYYRCFALPILFCSSRRAGGIFGAYTGDTPVTTGASLFLIFARILFCSSRRVGGTVQSRHYQGRSRNATADTPVTTGAPLFLIFSRILFCSSRRVGGTVQRRHYQRRSRNATGDTPVTTGAPLSSSSPEFSSVVAAVPATSSPSHSIIMRHVIPPATTARPGHRRYFFHRHVPFRCYPESKPAISHPVNCQTV